MTFIRFLNIHLSNSSSKIKKVIKQKYKVKSFDNSIKFYLPRTPGYLEIIKKMKNEYENMSLYEFDGYFKGEFEPIKYTRLEIHTNDINEAKITRSANRMRKKLKQQSLAFEYNNKLIIVEE
jgi:hypothetical protein